MFKTFTADKQSLKDHCLSIFSSHQITVTKQSLDSRFTVEAVRFVRSLVENQLQSIFSTSFNYALQGFNRVIVQDSTRFGLPDQFMDHFKSYGGRSSKSGLQIQFSYDLSNYKIHQIDLDSATTCDRIYSKKVDWLSKGDLLIRDLGYFAMKGFEQIMKREAFYLSRAFPRTALFERKSGRFHRFDLNKLLTKMRANQIELFEKDLFFGLEDKMPTRVIIQRVPDHIRDERIRNKKSNHKAKSKEYALWAGINVYLTNTSKEELPAKQAIKLYRARWQVELVFKTWKSYYQINKFKAFKINRLMCYLYSSLLLVLLQWQVFTYLQEKSFTSNKKLLSLHKYVKMMIHFKEAWVDIFRCTHGALRRLTNKIKCLSQLYLEKEKKKSKAGFSDLITKPNSLNLNYRKSESPALLKTKNYTSGH
jgi:hypothetical protein